MLEYLRDHWTKWRLRARYERLIQERVLDLMERRGPQRESEDAEGWTLLGGSKSPFDGGRREDLRSQARRLVRTNPYARNALRLLEVYVVGPGLKLTPCPYDPNSLLATEESQLVEQLWREFLTQNQAHFSYCEYARRAWRDGEVFLRLYGGQSWPPTVRFVDPEAIAATRDEPDSQGILTEPGDVESVVAYVRVDPRNGEVIEQIPATEMLQTRLGVDSNEKRGITVFASIVEALSCYDRWLETELQARQLQASIVLWRRVNGSPSQVMGLAESAGTGRTLSGLGKERYHPGSIVTTSQGTDLQFLQPNTNFGDAVPLGRMVLLSIAAGAGLPEFMLSSDASNGAYASTMVAEGPAVKLFESEQQFFAHEFERLWRWVVEQGVAAGILSDGVLERVQPQWSFPQLVNRNRPAERMADVQLVQAGVLSRAEVGRRDQVDPAVMQAELAVETAALS